MTTTAITITAYVLAACGLTLLLGVFNAFGPVRTERGLRRLGWAFIAAAVATAMTLSTPTSSNQSATGKGQQTATTSTRMSSQRH